MRARRDGSQRGKLEGNKALSDTIPEKRNLLQGGREQDIKLIAI